MADIFLRSENTQGKTCIPHYFIDKYMPRANGEYVKVYIYILRCFDDDSMTISTSEIADIFDYSEKSVIRALHYWADEGLLALSFNKNAEITGITLLNTGSDAVPARAQDQRRQDQAPAAPQKVDNIAPVPYDDADRAELLQIAETYVGRPISLKETEFLYSWLDELSLPSEVIDYLIDYSVSHGHDAFSYMNKIACDWASSGIKTVSEAKNYSFDKDMASTYHQIQTTFGLTQRSLTPLEKDYIKKWVFSMGMPVELIINACERTIKNTGKASFDYTDSILKSWHSKNALNLESVSNLDNEYKSRFVKPQASEGSQNTKRRDWNFEQRDYDMQSIEKQLLKKV